MWDSEFEFEDDDCEGESYDCGIAEAARQDGSNQLTDKLRIENAYYEAEDVILRDPVLAASRFKELAILLSTKLETDNAPTSPMPIAVLQKWLLKVFQHLVKLPVPTTQERWAHFSKLLELSHQVAWAESSGAITGALDAFEDSEARNNQTSSDNESSIVIEAHEAAARVALERHIVSGWRQIALRLTHHLRKAGSRDKVLYWLELLYRDWLKGVLIAAKYPDAEATSEKVGLEDPLLLKAIQAAPNEDSHLLEIIAIDLDRCEEEGLRVRSYKLIGKCLSSSRVYLQKKTLIGVRRHVAKYHFLRGNYHEAYTAFFDGWEAVCSVGDTKLGRELLLSIMVCNVLSGSQIDPRTTREAHSLLHSGQGASLENFREQVEHLVALNNAVKANDITEVQKVLNTPGSFTAVDPLSLEADVSGALLRRVRFRRLAELCSLWLTMDIEWLVDELHFTSMKDCHAFLLQCIGHPTTPIKATIDNGFLRVHHRSQEELLGRDAMRGCQKLLEKLEPYILQVL